MTKNEIAEYLLNNYGQCQISHCSCRCTKIKCDCGGGIWLGRQCPNWKPFDAKTYDELRLAQREFRKSTK